MKEILKRTIAKVLMKAGFTSIEGNALEFLIETMDNKIISTLRIVSQQALLAGRSSISMLDLFGIKQKNRLLTKKIDFSKDVLNECNVSVANCKHPDVRNMFSVIPIEETEYPYEFIEKDVDWVSPISTKFEKFIHIYDFMPDFPPIHTFRQTILKTQISKNQSSKVKNRLEQSLRTEDNMIKLIKSSGSIPKFINFMYRRNR